LDDDGKKAVAARVYLQDWKDGWQFAKPDAPGGATLPFDRHYPATKSIEKHTACSAHPFAFDVPPGDYVLTVERGKEYHTKIVSIRVPVEGIETRVRLRRWIDLSKAGWYSGDTHVHRSYEDMPVVQMAEDVNVAFPLTYWVTEAYKPPADGEKSKPFPGKVGVQPIDRTHVFWPCNTEYEIFRTGGKQHTLGAVFAIGHREPLPMGIPPLKPVAAEVRRQKGLLELDKHNWEWSMAIIPIMNVDLFELSNNHTWRTEFGFPGWAIQAPEYMHTSRTAAGYTEWGWIDYGFQNYYALLNCGYRLRPTGGTAAGVHPVPMGWGRVYVQTGNPFSYERWMDGLNKGRSFVTTGPVLWAEVNGARHGSTLRLNEDATEPLRITGLAQSARPLRKIEVIWNGEVVAEVNPANRHTARDGYESPIGIELPIRTSGWVCVRCFEDLPAGRIRFAHTAPIYVDWPGKPLRPRRVEVEFLVNRVKDEIARSGKVIVPEALAEYQEALAIWERQLTTSR
jgi:hypothetical protein